MLIYVDDPKAGLEWYQKAFPEAEKRTVAEFEYLEYHGVTIEIVPADEKVASGPAGTVVYWQTDDFQKRLDFLLVLGATPYRGPMDIGSGKKMCQVRDLWAISVLKVGLCVKLGCCVEASRSTQNLPSG